MCVIMVHILCKTLCVLISVVVRGTPSRNRLPGLESQLGHSVALDLGQVT